MRDSRLADKSRRERVGFDNFYHAEWTAPTVEEYARRMEYESAVLALAEARL